VGLFEKLFPPRAKEAAQTSAHFKTLSAYSPAFTSRVGGVYEMELTRSAIHAFATHASKLKPEVSGDPALASRLAYQPNPWMTGSQFLYRVATILEADTTAFIIPLTDGTGRDIIGLYPLLPSRTEIVEFDDEPWMRYTFANGQRAAIEFSRVGILTSRQYTDDFFGAGHTALSPTLDLLDAQRQGMEEGITSSAAIRFMVKLGQTLRPEDVTKERDRFTAENLSVDNKSGVMMFDAKYADVQQIDSKQYVIDAEQMKLIEDNVFGYFGVNKKLIQNDYDEDAWNAFYEGKVEPFALQLSLVLTNMFYDARARAAGSEIIFSSNRLQYVSIGSKVSVTTNLVDRGLMSNYAAAELWSLPKPPGEERWVIRGEYIDVANLNEHTVDQAKSYIKPPAKE
jgi:hypothetical protein